MFSELDGSSDDNEGQVAKGFVKLKEGINLNCLLSGAGETFEINFDSCPGNDENLYKPNEVDLDAAGACLGMDSDDDDDDINTTPFEKIAKKMVNVTEDGKIKKQIKRAGTGEIPPRDSLVSIHYSNYLEYNDEPTDFAYMKKPYTFRLGNAVVLGLNVAVQSMKLNEKSMFLIHPDYAFGKMGHPPRIPPSSTFLFQIELLRYVDSGSAIKFNSLTPEEKRKFPVAYNTALSLIEHAKEYFQHNLKLAIREYNKAVSLLEECTLSNMNDQEKQQMLLFKLYSNLAVCHTKSGNARKACTMCNNIYAMTKNTSLKIPAKVYFHNGRALFMLGDYPKAREKLLRARQMEPHNIDINNEIEKLTLKMQEETNRERSFAKALLKNNTSKETETVVETPTKVDDFFTNEIRSICENLMKVNVQSEVKLPMGLSSSEKLIAKIEAEKAGLRFRDNLADGKPVISKF